MSPEAGLGERAQRSKVSPHSRQSGWRPGPALHRVASWKLQPRQHERTLDCDLLAGQTHCVSPLFGNKSLKAEEELSAQAEAVRLASLSAAELAVEVMPAFGPGGPGRGELPELNFIQVGSWLMRDQPRGTKFLRDLEQPVRASIQALEVAGLVQHRGQSIA